MISSRKQDKADDGGKVRNTSKLLHDGKSFLLNVINTSIEKMGRFINKKLFTSGFE